MAGVAVPAYVLQKDSIRMVHPSLRYPWGTALSKGTIWNDPAGVMVWSKTPADT